MKEEEYCPEDWMELDNLILHIDNDDIDNQDYYEIDGWGMDIIKKAAQFIKTQLNIQTGSIVQESMLTDEIYEVNVWIDHGNGLTTALSKRKIEK